MRFIPTYVHAFFDYVGSLTLMASPWIFSFASHDIATVVPATCGGLVLVYSLFTHYELGVVPIIPMPTHLLLDGVFGVCLAVSPWVLGFAHVIAWPHGLFGALGLLAALTTKTVATHPHELRFQTPRSEIADRAMRGRI